MTIIFSVLTFFDYYIEDSRLSLTSLSHEKWEDIRKGPKRGIMKTEDEADYWKDPQETNVHKL